MAGNLLIVHGGAPTAVINCSLYGAVDEAKKSGKIGKIYGAEGGMGGVLAERFIRLDEVSDFRLELLKNSPGSAIGTSRDAMEAEDYANVAQILKKHDIRYALFNGGNGTMDTCGKVYKACKEAGLDILVAGIPKTMDNDIAITEHAPGFVSSARYMAGTVREICTDVRGLPIHVCIIEAMGRPAGWVTGAAALARQNDDIGPDLLYLPERDFSEDAFLADVEKHWAKGKGVVAVVSEGIHGPGIKPLVPPSSRPAALSTSAIFLPIWPNWWSKSLASKQETRSPVLPDVLPSTGAAKWTAGKPRKPDGLLYGLYWMEKPVSCLPSAA